MNIHAVFEGGGVKAIGLVGGVKAAEENGIRFKQVAGTSSGAIVASFLAAGYTADEMKKVIETMPFASFAADTWVHRMGWFGKALRICIKKGLYSGEALEYWVKGRLQEKGVRTFADLDKNQLRIIASDITDGRLLVLPDDISQYGINPAQMEIAKAIRMSTSIPFYFDPVILRRSGRLRGTGSSSHKMRSNAFPYEQRGATSSHIAGGAASPYVYIVDGGLLSNFPMWLFDREEEKKVRPIPTIGFELVGPTTNRPRSIKGPITMFEALFATMMEAHDQRYIETHHRFRTIKVPATGVQTTQFDITPEQSARLYSSGLEAGRRFFAKWSVQQYVSQFDQLIKLNHQA